MTFTRMLVAASLAVMVSGAACAQTAAPAPAPAAPAMTAPAAPAMAMDKKAVSKACSTEADQKGLKGKPRKSFRSKCKMEKMKGM